MTNLHIHKYPSPNFDERPKGTSIKHLVLHYTACDFDTALKYLVGSTPPNRVSSHYLVDELGRIFQLVEEEYRSWHAGSQSQWEKDINLNSTSIGIEIVNLGHAQNPLPVYPKKQIRAVKKLCLDIIQRHNIQPWYVLGHSDICITRKIDPGEHFPWRELARAGIGQYPPAQLPLKDICLSAYPDLLKDYGYAKDQDITDIICAFQRRFCPRRIDGHMHKEDFLKLCWLLENKNSLKRAYA